MACVTKPLTITDKNVFLIRPLIDDTYCPSSIMLTLKILFNNEFILFNLGILLVVSKLLKCIGAPMYQR